MYAVFAGDDSRLEKAKKGDEASMIQRCLYKCQIYDIYREAQGCGSMPINFVMLRSDQTPKKLRYANGRNGHLRVHYHLNAGGKKMPIQSFQ